MIITSIGAITETITALITIAIVLMEPSSSLLPILLAVPIAWEALPKPIPRPMGDDNLNNLNIKGLMRTPLTPAITTKTAASDIDPSSDSAIETATGVVTDFGTIERISSRSNPNSFVNRRPVDTPIKEPAVTPERMGTASFFRRSK